MPQRSVSTERHRSVRALLVVAVAALLLSLPLRISGQTGGSGWHVVAWNNLGMHCLDADFGVFAILPPYNTIQAHVIDPGGKLVTSPAGLRLTYEGVADPTGSINTTSTGKTNFWSFVNALFGAALPVDVGLLNHNMPGAANTPQAMAFDPTLNWFIAEGIPITPYDNQGKKNFYPLMRIRASDTAGTTLATTDIVLPVSDEMDCSACHSSGSGAAAQPRRGWAFDPNPQRDFRRNILYLHDDLQLGSAAYSAALTALAYDPRGLGATADGGRPILCASCHLSEALPNSGLSGITPLTTAMHTGHAPVIDPTNGLSLDSSSNRSACYRCHPGSETRCLRGVMGNSVAPDGSMAIQCQNCHGPMHTVGASTRTGWLEEPTCQNCHTGTATLNSGAIRFTSAFDSTGRPRAAADPTFATEANMPGQGLALYRFSRGHGGLQCSTCHGSTHAEYPSSHPNDNIQSVSLQGHVGTIGECRACHTQVPSTVNGGPHGMHPVGASWVSGHEDAAEQNAGQCRTCHGSNYRGTELSRAMGDRVLSTKFGTKRFFRGAQIGCYACHSGPTNDNANPNRAPVASNLTGTTPLGVALPLTLVATDADGNSLTYRIVSQPANGTVSLAGARATYFPFAGFTGNDTFTYAAWDGSVDSNLATATLVVTGCTLSVTATAPATATTGAVAAFTATPTVAGCAGTVAWDWNFGDGTAHATTQNAMHVYAAAGTLTWSVTASIAGVTALKTGSIVVSTPPGPVVTSVRALTSPFRIQIDGQNFQAGVKVYIGTSAEAWRTTTLSGSTRVVLSGTGLSSRFPRRVAVAIKVVNPDGRFATTTFTR